MLRPTMTTTPNRTPSADWHALAADDALAALGCDPATGLGTAEAVRRLAEHGPNALPEAPAQPAWRVFVRQLRSPLVAILFVAAVLAVALGHLGDAGVILVVVVVNALFGSHQVGRA